MSPEFVIELDREEGVYYSGEAVKGKVRILNDSTVSKSSGYIVLVEKQIAHMQNRVWGYQCDKNMEHNKYFDFTVHIPNYFYSSCISKLGKYVYLLKAVFGYSNEKGFTEKEVFKGITIVRPLDLELFSYIYGGIWSLHDNPYIKCVFEHGAFIPEQPMKFKIVLLKNMSLKKIRVSLWQVIKTGYYPFKRNTKHLQNIIIDSLVLPMNNCKKGQSFTGSLQLPKGIALSTKYPIYARSNFYYFDVVHIEYFIKICLCRKYWKALHFMGEEIIIGTRPLRSNNEAFVLKPERKDPVNFVLEEEPKAIDYAFIPKPGVLGVEE